MRRLEFYIEKEELQIALNDASRIVQKKSHFPILSGIKLEVMTDHIFITGNNGEVAINRRLSGDSLTVIESGSIVISAKNLLEIVKKLPGKVYVKSSTNQISIRSGDTIVHLPVFRSTEYPDLPRMSQENSITVSSEDFIQIIKQTVFAVAKDFSRPLLTGVHFITRDGELTCVATNSQRLALRKMPIESNYDISFTVPGSSLNELLKLHNLQDDLHIAWCQTHIAFKTETFSLYSNLIEGTFPNASKLIPDTFKTTLILDTKRLLGGIDRACLFSNEWRNYNILLEVFDESRIKISSKGTEFGRIEETQEVRERSGKDDFRVTLDARFLREALKVIEGDTVKISYSDEMKPILIEPVGNSKHLHLVSPVRTN